MSSFPGLPAAVSAKRVISVSHGWGDGDRVNEGFNGRLGRFVSSLTESHTHSEERFADWVKIIKPTHPPVPGQLNSGMKLVAM